MQVAKKLGHSAQLIALMQYCIEQKVIGQTCGKVFIAIAANWNPSLKINPSRETLCRRAGLKDPRSISNHIKTLAKLNLISYYQPKSKEWFGQVCNKSNHYLLDWDNLRQLFFKAKAKAKAEAAKAKRRTDRLEAKLIHTAAKNIPAQNGKNIPTISSSLRSLQLRSIIAAKRCGSLKNIIFEAYEHLCNHGEKLKRLSGLRNWQRQQGINRTARQEREYQAQQRVAAKVMPQVEATQSEINALKSDLAMCDKIPERFDCTKRKRLLELAGSLCGMDKLRLNTFDLTNKI